VYIEIEAKLKVDSLKAIEKRLKAFGAKFHRASIHTDSYFDDAKGSLRKSDSALRIRHRFIGKKKQDVITFKGPKKAGRFKRRLEIQFEVEDAKLAEAFLLAIGYKKTLVYQKQRQTWKLGGCEVALDKLPLLGTFVEIEGPGEKAIANVQKKLGLSDLNHIMENYAVLMKKKMQKLGRKGTTVLL
jgi:adenylate cyclase, class 2